MFLPTGGACYILYEGDLRFFAEGTQTLQVQKRLVPGILAPLFEIKYGFGFANLLSATKFMFFNSFLQFPVFRNQKLINFVQIGKNTFLSFPVYIHFQTYN